MTATHASTSRRPLIHFVFAPHGGEDTAKALRAAINEDREIGRRIAFIGVEGAGVKTAERMEEERRYSAGGQGEHRRRIAEVAEECGAKIRLLEAARTKQHTKIDREIRARFPGGLITPDHPGYSKTDFKNALRRQTSYFYKNLNFVFLARHDEVWRNLKREIRSLGGNEVGFVTFGYEHAGLERFIAAKLKESGAGIELKTSNWRDRNHYISIQREVTRKCFEQPRKRTPSEDELAQMALENLLKLHDVEFAYRVAMPDKHRRMLEAVKTANGIKRRIKQLSCAQIERVWEPIRNFDLVRNHHPDVVGWAERIGEIDGIVRTAVSQTAASLN